MKPDLLEPSVLGASEHVSCMDGEPGMLRTDSEWCSASLSEPGEGSVAGLFCFLELFHQCRFAWDLLCD